MIPIWALNKKTGRHEVFPCDLLEKVDGQWGMAFKNWENNYRHREWFGEFRDLFALNPIYCTHDKHGHYLFYPLRKYSSGVAKAQTLGDT